MLNKNKMKKRKLWTFLAAVTAVSLSYLYIDGINVFIETNSEKEELFYIVTAINYSEILKSTTRGRAKRLVKSGSVQRVPIQLDNILFFSHIFANVYHPDYVFQQKQHAHRTIFWTLNFPSFRPRTWENVMNKNTTIRGSKAPDGLDKLYAWSQAIESGELVRIVDVLGHLRRFKEDYIPLFLEKGTKKQLRRYLPSLEAIVAYTKANTEVNYDQLDEYDQKYIQMMVQELQEITVLLKTKESNSITGKSSVRVDA